MTISPRVEEFLAKYAAMSDEERRELHRTPEFHYLLARIRFRDDEPVPPELLDLALELDLRYPHPLEHYRKRAEDAPRRRELAKRLAASSPFSLGATR